MTKTEFAALPFLITRAQFMEVTGLNRDQIDALKEAGEVHTFATKPRRYYRKGQRIQAARSCGKYYKVEAAKIAGLAI